MSDPTVTVTRRGVDRIASGHLWVYESDVQRGPAPQAGSIVRVVDGRGWFQGHAFYSSKSKITLRMLTHEDELCDRGFFLRRFAAAKKLREALFGEVTAWRAVNGEADLLPGIVVDRYGDALVVQLLSQGADALRELVVDVLKELYRPKVIVERSDAKVRLLEGLEQKKGVLFGEAPQGEVEYLEGDIRLTVDLMGGQKTGAFLDQRENHIASRQYASGRALDCFSYAGGFALQLARKCERVTAVEISDAAGALITANAKRNGLANVDVVVENAFDFLKRASNGPDRWDTIVLDPPAFAKNKASLPAAERGYKDINLRAFQIVEPGGIVITASCSYHVGEEHFESIVLSAASDAQRHVQVLEKRGAGRDHPVLLGVPETRYLKCLILRVL